jgi:hypothetical protein
MKIGFVKWSMLSSSIIFNICIPKHIAFRKLCNGTPIFGTFVPSNRQTGMEERPPIH